MPTDLQNPYCTVQQVRDYIRNTDAAVADQLADAINAASRYIDRYKGRDYFEHVFTEEAPLIIDRFSKAIFEDPGRPMFDAHGLAHGRRLRILQLRWRVIELVSVTVAGIAWVEGTDFKIRAEEGQLIALSVNWPEAILDADAISIQGRFGYSQTATDTLDPTAVPDGIPQNITAGCVQIAAALSRQNFKDVVGLDGQKSSLLDITIPKSAMLLLGSQALLT